MSKYLLTILLLFGPLFCLYGQETTPEPSPTPEQAKSVSLQDFIPEIEAQSGFVKEANQLADLEKLKELRSTISNIDSKSIETINTIRNSLEVPNVNYSFEDLAEFEAPLFKVSESINAQKELISNQIKKLSKSQKEVQSRLKRWNTTLDELKESPSSELVETKVKSAISELQKTSKRLQDYVDQLIILQSDLLNSSLRIDSQLQSLGEVRETLRSNLLAHDDTPLYSGEFWEGISSDLLLKLSNSFREDINEIKGYLLANKRQGVLHLIIALVIYLTILQFKKLSFIKESFPTLGSSPNTIALICILLLAYPIYEDANRSFYDLVGVLLVIPLVYFFKHVFENKYTYSVVGVGLLYVGDRFRNVFYDLTNVNHIILLVETCNCFSFVPAIGC